MLSISFEKDHKDNWKWEIVCFGVQISQFKKRIADLILHKFYRVKSNNCEINL